MICPSRQGRKGIFPFEINRQDQEDPESVVEPEMSIESSSRHYRRTRLRLVWQSEIIQLEFPLVISPNPFWSTMDHVLKREF